ncbi:MAG: hypothetical protein BJ554DRAFT_6649 [Olpidium bornovanus]|uniref:Uncharacterized protein n=1 Tax=Olpidium bornovanus TaxID=278681 RepID=A0A8H7ZXV4_9FUNG|nr:MAG: hypothetical protein BJ554DRAFT_6649 [Olpidium bornovanus]
MAASAVRSNPDFSTAPLRKFKLVFLGEQSGTRRKRRRRKKEKTLQGAAAGGEEGEEAGVCLAALCGLPVLPACGSFARVLSC